ncbi:zinc finger protein 462-like isoform X2 [Cheilinus undulatus]|uniref:zinc finger protein 462-like isoform X2 n=1 Tax=Cheilinus undulatus TaxID=241271 RepID=UPI001BD2E9DF|nr:zinc finger protein 462-like isoform X2 [Cheilinus undulatus]
MQKDTVHIATSGNLTPHQAVTQELQMKSLQCSRCSLIFKSKVYLFEHLNKVHGFDVDVALTDAGLKHLGTQQTNTDIKSNNSRDNFGCQHCDFKAFSLDLLNEHEMQCQRTPENQNGFRTKIISENSKTKIIFVVKNHKEAERAEESSSVHPVKSTSKTECTLNSSKDLKTYKRPMQTITKYLVPSPELIQKPPALLEHTSKSPDGSKETLFLKESPSNSTPNSSGVFKVTAMHTIDISKSESTRFLLKDPFPGAGLKSPKPQGKITAPNNGEKRPVSEISGGPPVKKAKSDREKKIIPEKANESKHQCSNSKDLSFEFSDGEEERNLEDMDVETSTVYNCKHCDFKVVGIKLLANHYQNSHPHIRYNAVYLQDPTDHSATFRCLECPIEFSNLAKLQRHYTENHPEALLVLTMQSFDHNLVYKCFVCSFKTDELKALKEHYKEKHPTHEVGNSLMYCKFSARRCQEEKKSKSSGCEKVLSPEKAEEMSSESFHETCKEVRKTPSPQHPASTGTDLALYHCNICEFSHKSAVVMHVHYQRNHPGETVTIDKIKQSACVSSDTKSQKTLDKPLNSVVEKSTSTKSSTDSKTPRNKNKLSLKRIKLCLKKPLRSLEASKMHSESPKSRKVESAEEGSKGTKSPATQSREMSIEPDRLPISSSPNEQFYCQHCSYSSTNINSVVGHYNTKHSGHEQTDVLKIASYSDEVEKRKKIQVSPSSVPSETKPCERVEVCSGSEHQNMEEKSAGESVVEHNAYDCPENLFYCERCNLGNPTLKGVLNHQARVHKNMKTKRERIIKHTASIRDQINKTKSQKNDTAVHLPLPILNEGETNVFFCHLCNYRNCNFKEVLRHYFTRHPRFKVGEDRIRRYSSLIHEKLKRLPQEMPADHEVECESLCEKGDKKAKQKVLNKVSESSSGTASQTERTLKCHVCPYKTQHFYLLRRHMKQVHKLNRTVPEVLRMCYKQGIIQAGYHCEMCVFSHQTAEEVFQHYREKHPKQPSLEYVMTRLHVGPKPTKSTKKKRQIKQTESLNDVVTTDGISPSLRSGQNETKAYSCKACSFKSDSMSNITHHYRAVHPWSVKEDGSVLDVIEIRKTGANRQLDDHSDKPVTTDNIQMSLEFENSPGSSDKVKKSSKKFKCHYCSAKYHTQRRLDSHLALKHKEAATENVELKEGQMNNQSRIHVFKCPYCTYVNTNYHGVLTHCQMRHPGSVSRANSLHVDGENLKNLKDCLKRKGQRLRLSGYMCKTCPQICATLEKLIRHRKKNHHGTAVNTVPTKLKLPLKPSAVMKQTQAKIRSNQGFISKASLFKKKQRAMIKCPHCSYKGSTQVGLGRHILLQHNNASAPTAGDPPYKCALCSNAYFRKKLLGTHYAQKHGKETFDKYFVPLTKQVEKSPRPTSPHCVSAQQHKNNLDTSSTETAENKVMVFKCPKCTYVNSSYHGVLTHCQMSHPKFTARADNLKMEEILVTNMVGFSKGSSNKRGYKCKKCPQIHCSMKKLKTHCKRDHSKTEATTPRLVLKIKTPKKQQDYGFEQSILEAFSLKKDASVASITEPDSAQELDTPEPVQSNTASEQNKEMSYPCHICSYKGGFRRYLQSHYRKFHKIDVLTTHKLLEKYNKRRPKSDADQLDAQAVESTAVECKICPNIKLDSPELLIDHFRTVHNSDRILDFIVLSRASHRSTGLYKCIHCKKQLNGIKKMCYHLDRHRESENMKANEAKTDTSDVITTTPEDKLMESELPVLETLEELEVWTGAPVETLILPKSPLSSPTKPADTDQPEEDSKEDLPACKRCGRTFMSLKGLRSHERSHEAFAAIKKHTLPESIPKHKINKYIIYKSGTTKPFVCSFCSYRTNVMGLWRRHFMKNHEDVLDDPIEDEDQDEDDTQSGTEPHPSEESSDIPKLDEKPETNKRSIYSEPPDVQRQLNQYNFLAQSSVSSEATMNETRLPDSSLLHCELCNFNTEHISSIRRHYVNRHGKKLFKCKDCEFLTYSRKNLEMHMERGHSAFQSEPTHQKDLSCPFCLYQTKNKNNMIDHIVLHREERLVPIEVRRPKLSRYLQGIVFRCHNCTFTCGSAENLNLHMVKHHDIKPYKCRLCFFDCTRLSDLEAHLSDKHQVLRNHELVGHVSLDQLEARLGRMPEDGEEPLSDSDHHNFDQDIVKTEEMVADWNEVLQETQVKNPEENVMEQITLKIEDIYQLKDMEDSNRNEEGHGSHLDSWCVNDKNSVPEKHEQDQDEEEGTVCLPGIAKGQGVENIIDQNLGESMEFEDYGSQERERQTTAKVAQTILKESEDSGTTITQEQDEDKPHMKTLQENVGITEEREEKEILHGEIKDTKEILDEDCSTNLTTNQNNQANTEANNSHRSENNTGAKESFAFQITPLHPSNAQHKISHKKSSGVSLAHCYEEQVHKQSSAEESRDPYGEMPVLENEYFKEGMGPLDRWREGDHTYHLKQEQDIENEMICGDDTDGRLAEHDKGDGIKESEKHNMPKVIDGAAEDPCSVATEQKQFACEFCGRNLMNSLDLQRHVARHGI